MTPATRALIVSLLEKHSIAEVHGMMRRNPDTEPVEHVTLRSIRRTMLRAGASHHKRGIITMTAETRAMIRAVLEKCAPVEAFHMLANNVAGVEVSLGQVKEVRREMLRAGASRIAKRGPKRLYTEEQIAERRRIQQRHHARAKRAAIAEHEAPQTDGNRRLVEAIEAMFARKARRLGCSHEAARLATLYSAAQLQQRLAA